jgi:hypothetical protein
VKRRGLSALESTPAANDPHQQHRLTLRPGAQVDVWVNLPAEVNPGHCARLVVDAPPGIGAWGRASKDAALEALAQDLELLASKVRGMKGRK